MAKIIAGIIVGGNKDEIKIQFLVFFLSLLLYLGFIANGFNFFDIVTYSSTLVQAFKTNNSVLPFTAFGAYGPGSTQGLGRSPFYVLLSYPYSFLLTKVFGIGLEMALNSLSALIVALSCVFVYKISRLYLNAKVSMISVLLYAITPMVFFLGINSFNYSLVILLSAAWLYYLLLYLKNSDRKYFYISSALLVANIYTHQIAIPLLLPHVYFLFKTSRKLDWIIKNTIIFIPAALLLYYFTFLNPAVPVRPNLLILAFEAAIFSWEFVNGLSVVFFLLFATSFILLLMRTWSKKLDNLDILFLLIFIGLLSILFYFNDIPIIRFIAIFPLLPVFILRTLKNYKSLGKYFNFLVYITIIFMLVKFLPIAYQLHVYPNPHQVYSQWLTSFSSTLILVGHECPYVQFYTNLNILCKSTQEMNISLPASGVLVTQEYFQNENEMEFDFMQKIIHLPFNSLVASEILKINILDGKNITKIAVYPEKVRFFEDGFQWLFTVYPNPFINIFVNIDFIKPQYAIYKVS